MSSGSFVFEQWDSHHLRTRLVVVKIIVSRETDRSLASNQETALNLIILFESVLKELASFENTRKVQGPIVDPSERSNSKLSQALEGFPECLLLGLGNLFLIAKPQQALTNV